MRRYLVFFLLTTILLCWNYRGMTITTVSGQDEVLLTKLWELEFHGEPTTDIVKISGAPDGAVVGTSLGLVYMDASGIGWVAHIGRVVINPVVLGDSIYVAVSDKLYIFNRDGVGSSLGISGINNIGSWASNITVSMLVGDKSHIIVFDSALNIVTEFNLNFVAGYIIDGDINGDGDIDIVLCSKFGRVESYDLSGSLLVNVSLSLPHGENVDIDPKVGDVDGDNKDEIIIPVTPLRRQGYVSSLVIVDDSGVVERLNYSVRMQAIDLYDIDNDGRLDIFVGYDLGYFALDYADNETIMNVSTEGIAEGFYGYVRIDDFDADGGIEFLYIDSKGSLVLANITGIEKIYGISNEYIYTFEAGSFSSSSEEAIVVTLSGHVEIVGILTWNKVTDFGLIGGLRGGFHPTIYGNGSVLIPLPNGKILLGDQDGDLTYYGPFNLLSQPVYGDVDGDGYEEGIITDYQIGETRIYVVDANMFYIITNVSGAVYGVSLADLDRDGTDEIIMNCGDKVIVYGSTSWNLNIGEALVEIPLPVFDVDNDLELEIVAVSQGGSMYILSMDGEIEGRFDIPIIPTNPLIVGDIDMDRGAEFLTVHSGALKCIGLDGSIEFIVSKELLEYYPYPLVTDFDSDGYLEEIVAFDNNITIFDHCGEEVKTLSFDDDVSGFAVIDMDSDWIQDIVVATPGKLYIRNLVTGDEIMSVASNLIGEYAEIFAGDFDGDELMEIVVVSSGIIYYEATTEALGSSKCYGVNKLMVFNTLNYDRDGDLLTDYEEMVLYGTNPYLKDTDGDGFDDRMEILNGWDPNDPGVPKRYPIFWISFILSLIALIIIAYIYREKTPKK